MDYFRALLGLLFFVGVAFAFSNNRKGIDWKLVSSGILLQVIIGIMIAKIPFVNTMFETLSTGFVRFLNFSIVGAEFLYGDLAKNSNSDPSVNHNLGFLFAFQALPMVIFFSAVTVGLYYLGVLQKIVYVFAWIMSKTMHLSGAESLSVAGNIFLGQTEAPLLVRPFIPKMTQSELHCLMTGGMATIAGSVLGIYVSFLGGGDPVQQTKFATYLLSASIMNAPAAIVMAKIFYPENDRDQINTDLKVSKDQHGVNFIDALTKGASMGLKLALNIGAMLLAFIAVIYAFNWILKDGFGEWFGINTIIINSSGGNFDGLTLQYLLGQVFRYIAFMMGVDWNETVLVGSLLGQKTVINELVAYMELAKMNAAGLLSPKSITISTYALCGFANFGSIAIQIGGIGGLAPKRQADLSRLGLKALVAASFATMMTGTIAGALIE